MFNFKKKPKKIIDNSPLCPIDAKMTMTTLKKVFCDKTRHGYRCTRDKGHEGEHHAHSFFDNNCLLVWIDEKERDV